MKKSDKKVVKATATKAKPAKVENKPAKKEKPTPTIKRPAKPEKRADVPDKKAKKTGVKEPVKAKKVKDKPAQLEDGQSWYRTKDLPWCDKKVTLIKYLKQKKAFSADKARSSGDIAEATGLSGKDVRHYGYHGKAGGYIDLVTDRVGKSGYLFYLTPKGQACDPAKELKQRQKEKAVKKAS